MYIVSQTILVLLLIVVIVIIIVVIPLFVVIVIGLKTTVPRMEVMVDKHVSDHTLFV